MAELSMLVKPTVQEKRPGGLFVMTDHRFGLKGATKTKWYTNSPPWKPALDSLLANNPCVVLNTPKTPR